MYSAVTCHRYTFCVSVGYDMLVDEKRPPISFRMSRRHFTVAHIVLVTQYDTILYIPDLIIFANDKNWYGLYQIDTCAIIYYFEKCILRFVKIHSHFRKLG